MRAKPKKVAALFYNILLMLISAPTFANTYWAGVASFLDKTNANRFVAANQAKFAEPLEVSPQVDISVAPPQNNMPAAKEQRELSVSKSVGVKKLVREIIPRISAKVEWVTETNGGDSQKFDVVLEPGLQLELLGQLRFTALGRVRTDPVGDLEPGRPAQSSVARPTRRWWPNDRTEAEIRELYVDVPINKWLIRAGKQQVVWGQADGLKVLDLVNPQSFREFILADFEDCLDFDRCR